jgi:hypothetical protein
MIKNNEDTIIDLPEGVKDYLGQKPEIEVTVKVDGKTVYHNKAYALVMNMVQSVVTLDLKNGIQEGDSQVFGAGHPMIQVFALEQLKTKMIKEGSIKSAFETYEWMLKHPKLAQFGLQQLEEKLIKQIKTHKQ